MAHYTVALGLLVALTALVAVLKVIDSLSRELRLHVLVVVQSLVVDLRDLFTRVQFRVRRRRDGTVVVRERRDTVLVTGGGGVVV